MSGFIFGLGFLFAKVVFMVFAAISVFVGVYVFYHVRAFLRVRGRTKTGRATVERIRKSLHRGGVDGWRQQGVVLEQSRVPVAQLNNQVLDRMIRKGEVKQLWMNGVRYVRLVSN